MSLRTKLVRTMIAVLSIVASATLVAVVAVSYVSSRTALSTLESHLRTSIQHKGTGLVATQALALRDMVTDNAFGDVARLVDRTVEQDDQVIYGLFLDADLKPWRYAVRALGDGRGMPPDWQDLGIDTGSLQSTGVQMVTRTFFGHTVMEFSTPVVDDKGGLLGSLRYAITDRALQQALEDARAASRRALGTAVGLLLLLCAATLFVGSLLSRRAASRIARPISLLTTAVNSLAEGRRAIRVAIDSGDELELLGGAFNRMADELQQYYAQLEQMNRALEGRVAERTRELADRNRDMRLVLDNVHQGFLTLSLDGVLAYERSAIIDSWFGGYEVNARFADFMARVDPLYAESFELGYQAVLDDLLPRELCIEQLPQRLRHQGREFRCSYLPLGPSDRFEGLLVVIDDVTAELRAAEHDAERAEILAMFEALSRDRAGFLAFMDESNEQIARLASADLAFQKRLLHTLKGNCHLMGLTVVANLSQKGEEEIAETCAPLSQTSLARLEQRWLQLAKSLRGFLGERGRDIVEVPAGEIDRLDADARGGLSLDRLLDRLASWRLEPAERPLQRLAGHARALATRLGKGELAVTVDGGGVRLSPKGWSGLWSDLVHIVRNAVDHGLEAPGVREKAGKAMPPSLRLAARVEGRNLVIEIEDDGRGIDWPAVARAAAGRGLPHETHDDLVRALFTQDVTTRAEVTTISGRGVGLAAVRKQVEQRGGTIAVDSQAGSGTSFTLRFPVPNVGPRFGIEGGREPVIVAGGAASAARAMG